MGTRLVNGETLAGWSAVARSRHGRVDIMFGPIITAEAHLAFSGAGTHFNSAAETTATMEALSFLGPRGPAARDRIRVFVVTPNMLLVCVFGHGPSPHTCPGGTCVPTVDAKCPTQVTAYHTTRVRPHQDLG